MRSSRARTLALLLVCALTAPARAQDTTRVGNDHAARGQKLFVEGHYPEAIDELRAGLIATGQPRFLYALGQAYRMNHQCVDAVKAYRDFLRASPSHDQAADAEERIALCIAEDPSASSEPTTPAIVTTSEVTPPPAVPLSIDARPAPRPRTPVYKRWWLWTSVGVVGLGVGLGVGLTRSSGFAPTVKPFGEGH